MRHVFISCKHDDGDFAEILINKLEKAGFETWIDKNRLYAGEDWRAEIDQAIRDAFALVVIMSPEARSSEYVTYEWAFAYGTGLKIIPILYKDTKLHPRLEALQYLDFTSRTSRPWDALIEVVKNASSLPALNPKLTPASQSIPSYLKQAIEGLDSADDHERRDAITKLAKLDHPLAHQALIDALRHPLQDVRTRVAIELAQDKETKAIPILLEAIRDEYSSLFNYAAKALYQIGNAAIPNLLEALHNKDERVRSGAAQALGGIGNAISISELLEALHDGDESVRWSAVIALGKIGDASAVPGLLEALHDEVEKVREGAAGVLGMLGDASAVPGLLEILHDGSVIVRMSATKALGKIGDASAVPDLLRSLNRDGGISYAAAEALGDIGDASAVPGLLEALHDEYSQVRESAVEALGKIGDASAVPGLLELLYDEDGYTIQDIKRRDEFKRQKRVSSYHVAKALVKMGDAALPYLIEALHRKNLYVRGKVIEILGNIGNSTAVPELLQILRNESFLRKQVIEALMEIGDASAVPGLLEALQNNNLDVRRAASKSLMRLRDSKSVPELLEALKNNEDKTVRINIIETLGNIGDDKAVPELLEAVKNDGDQEALRSAAKALVKMGDAAVPDLINTLHDEKVNSRRKGIIANVLRQIGTSEALAAFNTSYHNRQDNNLSG